MKILGAVTIETRWVGPSGPFFDNTFPRKCSDGRIYAKGVSVY